MAQKDNIYQKCEKCDGTGETQTSLPNPPRIVNVTCSACNGEKQVYWGQIIKES